MNTDERNFYRLLNRAYARDGRMVHEGEALLIACLLHTQGAGRRSDDMKDVQRIMKDHNYRPAQD